MKILLFLLLSLFPLRAADIPWTTGERIVFCGDSITDAKFWTHYVQAYLYRRYPDKMLWIQQHGRSGTSMNTWFGGGTSYEEWPKVVASMAPNRVITMFGHNGGLSAAAWKADYETLITGSILPSGATPILIGPHPQSNSTGKVALGGTVLQPSATGYSTQLKDIAMAGGWPFSDTWNSLWPVYTNPANWSAIQFPGTQGTPQTHPGKSGHLLIAYTVIKQLEWGADVSGAEIDAGTMTVTATSDCTITNLSGSAQEGISFTRLDARLPWAIDEEGRAAATAMLPELAHWQQYTLKVTGLVAGNHSVTANGVELATLDAATLAAGWNMADLTVGPVWQSGQETLGRLRDLAGVNRSTLLKKSPNDGMVRYVGNAGAYYKAGQRGLILAASLVPALERLDVLTAAVRAAATPVPLNFTITPIP